MRQEHFISNQFLQNFAAIVQKHNGNLYELVKRSGMSSRTLEPTSQLVPLTTFVELLEISALELDAPDIALQLAYEQDIHILGPICNRLVKCSSVTEAIHTIAKYLEIVVSGVSIEIGEYDGYLSIRYASKDPKITSKKQFQDYALATAHKTLSEILGDQPVLRACYFTRQEKREKYIEQYAKYFGCPIAFNSEFLELVFDNAILSAPINQFIDKLNQRIRPLSSQHQNLQQNVSQIILLSLMHGAVSIDQVAFSLGFSARTLQRKLDVQGMKFSELLETVRLEKAEVYLNTTHYSLQTISDLVGYKHLSGFSRSYKRRFGQPPLKRRKLIELGSTNQHH